MALKQAFSSQSTAPVRLRQITTTPSTEDLRYVLATATQHKKPAELPFKNQYNGLTFIVRVVPATGQIAPRWTFERCEAGGQVHLWTRETNEVIMIQGKIKIEANYTGEGVPSQQNVPEHQTTDSAPIVMGNPEISAYDLPSMSANLDASRSNYESFTGSAGATCESGPSGVLGLTRAEQSNQVDLADTKSMVRVDRWSEVEAWSGGWSPGALEKLGANKGTSPSHTSSGSNWLFTDGNLAPVTLPPPVTLSADIVKNYLAALTNPASGLIRHSAFEFFLLRDLGYVSRCGVQISLLIFDFCKVPPSAEAHTTLCDILRDCSSALEICAQLKTGEYAILLCGYSLSSATDFALTLSNQIKDSSELFANCAELQSLAIGIAGVPYTCSDAGTLIAAAKKAKDMARESKRDYMVFPL